MRKKELRTQLRLTEGALERARFESHQWEVKAARAEGELVGVRFALRQLGDQDRRARERARAGESFDG